MKAGLSGTQERRPLLRDVPQWFRLGNYQRTAGLDPCAWCFQINVRQFCLTQLRDMCDPEPVSPEIHHLVRQALTTLQEDPICDPRRTPFSDDAFSSCYNVPEVQAVHSMTLESLFRIDGKVRGCLAQDRVRYANRVASGFKNEHPFMRLSYHPQWMRAVVEDICFVEGMEVPLVIDLSFPNSVLKKHFEAHLQRLRLRPKGKPKEARKKSPDMKEWAKLGVLPCMDLLLWGEQKGRRISAGLIASALGRGGYVDDEKVRRTLKPLAIGLLTRGEEVLTELSRLRALAYTDLLQRRQVRNRVHK